MSINTRFFISIAFFNAVACVCYLMEDVAKGYVLMVLSGLLTIAFLYWPEWKSQGALEADKSFLDCLCGGLEKEFPGIVAGFGDFITGYLGSTPDDVIMVEIFNVPDDARDVILEFCEDRGYEHLVSGGSFVSFRMWSIEKTQKNFLPDVEFIRARGKS